MENPEINNLVSDFSRVYIMTILYESPVHGYQIISRFKNIIGKDVSPSLVYPFLKQLEEKGLVKHSLKPVGNKQKKVFELTEEGKKFSQQLFKRFSEIIGAAITPTLEVCANCGCKVLEGSYKEKIRDKELSFCCCHCAESYKQNMGT